jgi:hypothetical protein
LRFRIEFAPRQILNVRLPPVFHFERYAQWKKEVAADAAATKPTTQSTGN